MPETKRKRHVVSVHGTFSGRGHFDSEDAANAQFFCEQSDFAKTLKGDLSVDAWHEFGWKGTNLESDRRSGSRRFAKFLKSLKLPPEDEVLILAHSHGGNIALDGLRKKPIPNTISLYSFGTPFIWKDSRHPFGAILSIMPNIIFFLAILALAFVIGSGHTQSLLYGVPYLDLPRNEQVNAFFKSFNSFTAYPVAILLVIASWLYLIGVPLGRTRYRAQFNYLDVNKFQLTRIWRTDDEAIAILSNEPNISAPISIFNSFFRFVAASLFVGFVLWAMYDGYYQFLDLRKNVDSTKSWNYVLPMGGEKMGLGLSVMILLALIYPFFRYILKAPLTWLMSRPVNSLLRKTSMGEDGYLRLDANNMPHIPRQFDNDFNESVQEIAPVLEAVKKNSDDYLLENRTTLMRMMSAGDGYLVDVFQNTDLTKSLIHCNYFTGDMARFIAKREANRKAAAKQAREAELAT